MEINKAQKCEHSRKDCDGLIRMFVESQQKK